MKQKWKSRCRIEFGSLPLCAAAVMSAFMAAVIFGLGAAAVLGIAPIPMEGEEMAENVENTKAEGHFAAEMPKTAPGMWGKPINTKAEGTLEKAQERECMEKIKLFLEYMRSTSRHKECTDRELADMHDAAEAIKWNIECIQKARKEGVRQ